MNSSFKNRMIIAVTMLMLFVTTIVLPSLMIVAEFVVDSRTKPPIGASIENIDTWCPKHSEFARIEHNGMIVTVAFGRPPIFPLKDFPAGYAFDENGKLWHWTSEASNLDKEAILWNKARQRLYPVSK